MVILRGTVAILCKHNSCQTSREEKADGVGKGTRQSFISSFFQNNTVFTTCSLLTVCHIFFFCSHKTKTLNQTRAKYPPSFKKKKKKKMSLIQKQHLFRRFLHPRDEMSDSGTDPLIPVKGYEEQNVAFQSS